MKILSAVQIRQTDQYSILSEHITSADLMERVAAASTEYILERSHSEESFVVICGKGNNGGDGLAIARMLLHAGHTVHVYILEYTEGGSADFLRNHLKLGQLPSMHIHPIRSADALHLHTHHKAIIIDAILGTGINKPTTGLIADVIGRINASGLDVIAIDVPSGLPVDAPMASEWPVVRASVTLTFQQPKLTFMFPESGAYVGEMKILNIGLDQDYIDTLESPYYFVQDGDIAPLLLRRQRFSHKGTFGHSLLISGSYGKMGAALLASHACLCSGTGLLTTHIPGCGYQIIQTALPEAMVSIDTASDFISVLPPLDAYSSIGIGPGIGRDPATAQAVEQLIRTAPCPLVIDADALNILSEHKAWLNVLPPLTILTPHPKEFDRLTETHADSYQRLKSAQALAHTHNIIIVLKGSYTATVMPDQSVWFNSTGNPALAKGGTGDVLTGIITALISRGYEPHRAAMTGVYLHGLAADIAVSDIHAESMLASDVIAHLSVAFEYLYGEINH
jgi:hydroxyethylthiazole kinase-like uncharacterized protein yjeF